MNRIPLSITLLSLITFISGCANHKGVPPSQNSTLQSVSPSTTAVSKGGAMQRGLDGWLKEEWVPLTASNVSPKENTTAPSTTISETTEENTSFSLQHYADKWKTYHENKNKMNEGKPKEASNIEKLEKLPVIGE